MPDHGEFQNNASPKNLEEAMWRLKVEDSNGHGLDVHQNPYPDRQGVPDCIYYLRTGLCGYGNNCRYNHPRYNGQGTRDKVELPERVGQPECQYFLKTGACKFGATCKYHHPRERDDAPPAPLNMLGLPMRQEEKPCPYYMRTGSCKFGIACKFNHPQPATYAFPGTSVALQSSMPLIGGLSAWPLARPYLPSPRMQGISAYVPVLLPQSSQGTMPMQQGWSTYTVTLGPSGLPLRPGHGICTYYATYGSCTYGSSCKYDHPLMGFYNYALPTNPQRQQK